MTRQLYALYTILIVFIVLLLWLLYLGVVQIIQIVKGHGVPNVTSNSDIVTHLIEHLDLHAGDCFIDLGAGSGVVVSNVSKAFPEASCIGYEFATLAYKKALYNKKRNKGNYALKQENFLVADLSQATHIYCYLMPHLMASVWKKVTTNCRPGTKIYVNAFPFPEVIPTKKIALPASGKFTKTLYVYTV